MSDEQDYRRTGKPSGAEVVFAFGCLAVAGLLATGFVVGLLVLIWHTALR